MSRPWVFGNTTIQNPNRMRDAMAALVEHPEACPRMGREHENAFAHFLRTQGIVTIERSARDGSDLGRKWRSGLVKLGFLYSEKSQTPFAVTPAGRRLVESASVNARQECFLRSLANCQLPSEIEPGFDCAVFYPLRLIVGVALELLDVTGNSAIDFAEMAGIVQYATGDDSAAMISHAIFDFRKERARTKQSKRDFDGAFLKGTAALHGYKAKTPHDYADSNLRYLKASGLFCSCGRGVCIVAHKLTLARLLVSHPPANLSGDAYISRLTAGGPLPTDDQDAAAAQLKALCELLRPN